MDLKKIEQKLARLKEFNEMSDKEYKRLPHDENYTAIELIQIEGDYEEDVSSLVDWVKRAAAELSSRSLCPDLLAELKPKRLKLESVAAKMMYDALEQVEHNLSQGALVPEDLEAVRKALHVARNQ